jgi:hypothetical protein
MYAVDNRNRHNITAQKPRDPIGDSEFQLRVAAYRDGSATLRERIEALIARTADTLAVPAQFSTRRPDYARAYLGFEVADPAEISSGD